MKKYLVLVVCSVQYLSAMDTIPTKTILWDSQAYAHESSHNPCEAALLDLLQGYSFDGLSVFVYDDFESVAEQVAQTAKVVHMDSTNLKNLEELKQEYAPITNLIFTEPQQNYYDCIVMCDPQKLTQSFIRKNLKKCRSLLKSSGQLFTVMRLNTDTCVLEQTFDQLYPKIYAAIAPEKRTELPEILDSNRKFLSHNLLTSKSNCLFEIELQNTTKYNIVIKNICDDLAMYCDWLTTSFARALQEFEISDTTMQTLQTQFVDLLSQKLKHDDEGNLLHPFNVTELILRKWILKIPLARSPKDVSQ